MAVERHKSKAIQNALKRKIKGASAGPMVKDNKKKGFPGLEKTHARNY